MIPISIWFFQKVAVLTKNRTEKTKRTKKSNGISKIKITLSQHDLCRIDEKCVAVRLTENSQTVGRGSFINRLRLRGGERSGPHNS